MLEPSRKLNRTIEYIVAVVAGRTDVCIHAVCVLSNHWHVVASDPEARIPEFLRDVHALIAKCVNAALGRWENVWSAEQTSLVRASGDEDVLERIVYTMANPVSAGLVANGDSWPGLRLCWPAVRKPVARPKQFFRDGGAMPESATLELARPPGFEDLEDEELAEHIEQAIDKREQEVRDQAAKEGKSFLGRRAVRKQSRFDSPRTREPRRRMSPRVAAKNKWRRIEALQRLEEFISGYREALRLWRTGLTEVEFPPGTYALRVHAGVRCAA